MTRFTELLAVLDQERPVLIQAHDFPDHDAVATAFALGQLLESRGIAATLCYGGEIQSDSLREAIERLGIQIYSSYELKQNQPELVEAQIIIVDGFVGNSNMTGIPGSVVSVIDHHEPPDTPDLPAFDIRPGYGACSTILYEYYHDEGVAVSREVATALLLGIMMDTAFMTRGVSPIDLEAFTFLFFRGDWQDASRMLKNSLSFHDLAVFREAINEVIVAEDFAFIPLKKECTPEVMALVADFFLNIREIHFVVVLQQDREDYRISVRSENPRAPAGKVIRTALEGIGSGGGHIHMGGGTIPLDLFPGEQGMRLRFLEALGK
ncbi:DHH family phosphoesterase [Spirochaeta africana]|uniref:Exopolyphosphatase-like enzyme n=1 Tax=Spirochaeta africana (strain ATCC 700263 / DSM 8902 / Z-7692) TaxID=889378 RepID=H9UMN3_SPIAZ|nr:DHH family phosphoesterase [Spirochaeta africana]AFG38776.1 exopolyphosphatase-like enzyme [Spirochaeta africana DSM 8902]